MRNVFILDLFAVGGKKESKYNESIPFWGYLKKPLGFERRVFEIRVFPDFFSFRHFFGVFPLFLDIKIKLIEFTSSRPFFKVVYRFI